MSSVGSLFSCCFCGSLAVRCLCPQRKLFPAQLWLVLWFTVILTLWDKSPFHASSQQFFNSLTDYSITLIWRSGFIMLFIKRDHIMLWAVAFAPTIFNPPPSMRNRKRWERDPELQPTHFCSAVYSPPITQHLAPPQQQAESRRCWKLRLMDESYRSALFVSGAVLSKLLPRFSQSRFRRLVFTKVWLEDTGFFFLPSSQSLPFVWQMTLGLCAHWGCCLFCLWRVAPFLFLWQDVFLS